MGRGVQPPPAPQTGTRETLQLTDGPLFNKTDNTDETGDTTSNTQSLTHVIFIMGSSLSLDL